MAIQLRPVRDDERPEFVRRCAEGYANDLEVNAQLSAAEAREKADLDVGELLPGGVPADGQYLLVIEDAESGDPVGRVWFGERARGARTVAWVYALEIDEAMRGRGLGRQAMLLLEDEVRRQGLPLIALNVFGANDRARSLYQSLGYVEDAIWMSKELG